MSNTANHPLAMSADMLVQNMVADKGVKATLDSLGKILGFESTPPTILEFIHDDFYLGDMIGSTIFPVWRHALQEIYPNPYYSPYTEIVATGGIGLGKSTFSLTGMMYDMCRILMHKNPQEFAGLTKSTKIAFALMNATQALAYGVLFDQFEEWCANSPFFRNQRKLSSGNTMFPKLVNLIAGSRFTDVLGMAVCGVILSELNFQTKVANQAIDNYNNTKTRMQTRFMGYFGKMKCYPGRMWLDSSKKDSGAMIEEYILKGRENDPSLRVYDYKTWEAQAHRLNLSGKNFKLFVGDIFKDPMILDHPSQILGLDESLVIDVPVEFENNFRMDIIRSLQDLAGIATQAAHKFIPSAERLEEAFIRPNPMFRDVIQLDFYDRSEALINYLDMAKIVPSSQPRCIHIDLGLVNDKTGIAATRLDSLISVERIDPLTGNKVVHTEPVYYTDFVIFIESKSGQEVPIYKIKQFLLDLRSRGYPMWIITTDGYQSSNLRQDLLLENLSVDLLSVDRTMDPYIELKNAVMEGRWNGIRHRILSKELRELEKSGHKVDHTIDGSKDGADAVCGSVWSVRNNLNRFTSTITSKSYLEGLNETTHSSNPYEVFSSMGATSHGYGVDNGLD